MIRAVETATRLDARRAALARLIDHAALFPPASMSMGDALAEDARVRAAPAGWILGRFVVPASRLGELGGAPLRLSVVADGPVPDDPRIEAVELPPGATVEVPPRIGEVYSELPLDADVPAWVAGAAERGRRVKVRCGGAVVPDVQRLAGVVRACRRLGVAFKATAGLHHPVRRGGEHGFLNLLAAALFPGDEAAALAEEDPAAFRLDGDALAWRGRAADGEEIARVRRGLFVGFGSCSVREPVEELAALGLLPA